MSQSSNRKWLWTQDDTFDVAFRGISQIDVIFHQQFCEVMVFTALGQNLPVSNRITCLGFVCSCDNGMQPITHVSDHRHAVTKCTDLRSQVAWCPMPVGVVLVNIVIRSLSTEINRKLFFNICYKWQRRLIWNQIKIFLKIRILILTLLRLVHGHVFNIT